MRKICALFLALLMTFTLFACSKKAGDEQKPDTQKDSNIDVKPNVTQPVVSEDTEFFPSDSATLKIAYSKDPVGMTQPGHSFGSAMTPANIFAETLIGWDSDLGDVVPKLATEWEWVDDYTLRLKLREDVTSIGGDPFTANDVIYTFKLNNETAALAAYYNFFDYEKTVAVDDYTVDLALQNPYPFLIQDLAHYAYSMCVEATMERIGFDNSIDDPSALTGPYKLVKWEQGQCIYAERRDDYWGVLPYYKYIEIWTVTDSTTRSMGVEAGDYNLAFSPATSAVLSSDGKTTKGWFTEAPGRILNMTLNSDSEPLNIKEVRQSIALAINYEALLQVSYNGQGVISDTSCYSPLNSLAYTPVSDPDKNFIKYDPELSKQKMTEAGFPDGFTITLNYSATEQMIISAAEMLQNQLGAVGIDLKLNPVESAVGHTYARNGEFDMLLASGGNPNPKRNINPMDGRRIDHNAANGSAGANWAPEGIEDVIDRCLYTVDDKARMEAFTEFNDICREYVPQVILYCPYAANLTSPDITHLGLDIMGTVEFLSLYPAEYIGK